MSLIKDKKDSEFLAEEKENGEVCIQDGDGLQMAHHHMIDPPSGKKSIGICKFCGDKKEFSNIPDFHYMGSRPRTRKRNSK